MRYRRGKAKTKPTAPKERINNQIRVPTVRLISDKGKQIGVVPISKALQEAETAGLDLVEISPNANPPVCKIMDFGTYYYKKERKLREARKNQHIVQTKEVKFGPNTEEHDYNFKKDHALKFLGQHNKVKLTVRFRGRQLAHREIGFQLLEKLIEELKQLVDVEVNPKNEGRTVFTIIAPKKDIDVLLEEYEKKED
ncbi:MAG: translation initiation factor IF-3 [Candidatus Cloacimonetes bacterium]|nr:translation initiation factor IF-3 [Candidatus Cloacimonadota bacterium]